MPPVLGPSSPSKARLWSWAAPNSSEVSPSHRANSEASSPAMNSSITTARPGRAERPPSMSSIAASASWRVVGDRHALAGGQAVGLDHVGRLEAIEGGLGLVRPLEHAIAGGGQIVAGAEVLGEGLGGFQPRRGRRVSEAGDSRDAPDGPRGRLPATPRGPPPPGPPRSPAPGRRGLRRRSRPRAAPRPGPPSRGCPARRPAASAGAIARSSRPGRARARRTPPEAPSWPLLWAAGPESVKRLAPGNGPRKASVRPRGLTCRPPLPASVSGLGHSSIGAGS